MKRAIALATESTRRDGTRQGFAALSDPGHSEHFRPGTW